MMRESLLRMAAMVEPELGRPQDTHEYVLSPVAEKILLNELFEHQWKSIIHEMERGFYNGIPVRVDPSVPPEYAVLVPRPRA